MRDEPRQEFLGNLLEYAAETDRDTRTLKAYYTLLEKHIEDIVDGIEESVYWDEETGDIQYGGISKKTSGLMDKIDKKEEKNNKEVSRALTLLHQGDVLEKMETANGSQFNWENSNIYELREISELDFESVRETYVDCARKGDVTEEDLEEVFAL